MKLLYLDNVKGLVYIECKNNVISLKIFVILISWEVVFVFGKYDFMDFFVIFISTCVENMLILI